MSSQYIRIVEEKTGFDPEIICTYCKQVHLTYVKVKKNNKKKHVYSKANKIHEVNREVTCTQIRC